MLQRTKYSRLRNDSLGSPDDRPPVPQGNPPPPHGETSTLRGFIPRMAGISLLGGLGALTHKSGHRNGDRHVDERPVLEAGADWTPGRAPQSPLQLQRGASYRRMTPTPAEEGGRTGSENTVVCHHHHHHHHVEIQPPNRGPWGGGGSVPTPLDVPRSDKKAFDLFSLC
ncbi:hypothetical protein NHX12_005521 [Muraenolepis orangiensis]|uniref:Uncharacterized protein n=1 Tax=Muraenolepis orangiensis TaxID=630683 RepID=A0A9Q0ICC9_9TELE|nr:hypothetical protein NHX12_005521 [Muraenolepis orangiensis]